MPWNRRALLVVMALLCVVDVVLIAGTVRIAAWAVAHHATATQRFVRITTAPSLGAPLPSVFCR